jgi:hypothetical protein
MHLDYFKIDDFWWDEEDDAIEQLAQALRDRNKRDFPNDPKPWSEQTIYDEARGAFEKAKEYARLSNPEMMRKQLNSDLAHMQRTGWTAIKVRNETPKKGRGRKRKVKLALVKGGYKKEEKMRWRAKDLLMEKGAS